MRKIIKYFLSPLISLAILAFLINKFEPNDLEAIIQNANPAILAAATAFFFILTPSLSALRWKTILKTMDCNISFRESLKLYMASLPLAKISPANSGDLIRAYYLRKKLAPGLNIGIIILERMLDFFMLAVFAIVCGAIINSLIAMSSGALFIIIIIGLFIFGKIIKIKKIEKMIHIFKIILKHPKTFALSAGYTILLWFVIISYIKFIFISLDTNVSFLLILATQPLVTFFSLFPFTISGIGIRESAMVFLYAGFAPEQTIFLTGLVYSFFGGIVLPMLGIPLLYGQFKLKKAYGK